MDGETSGTRYIRKSQCSALHGDNMKRINWTIILLQDLFVSLNYFCVASFLQEERDKHKKSMLGILALCALVNYRDAHFRIEKAFVYKGHGS